MTNLVALLFGAAIILVFSFERFNRATYQDRRQLKRLIEFLSPDQFRARSTVLNAYFLYSSSLLGTYFFLCAYADLIPAVGGPNLGNTELGAEKLPVLNPASDGGQMVAGFQKGSDGQSAQVLSSKSRDAASYDIGIMPQVSLGVALIIVGFAPAIPVLNRFEDWLRIASHRFAGIPTEVLEATAKLRAQSIAPLLLEDHAVPLVSLDNQNRLKIYAEESENKISGTSDFRQNLLKIFTISAWVIDRKLKFNDIPGQDRFNRFEDELRARLDRLKRDLDDAISGNDPQKKSSQSRKPGSKNAADFRAGKSREIWEKQAAKAEMLAEDMCLLVALYFEHEIISDKWIEDRFPLSTNHSHEHKTQETDKDIEPHLGEQREAEVLLAQFLERLSDDRPTGSRRTFTVLTWLWAFFVVCATSALWACFPGQWEMAMQLEASSIYYRIWMYVMTAFSSFCIPLLVALVIRRGAMELHRWKSIWNSHWTYRLPSGAFIVVTSWLVASAFIVGFAMWTSALQTGWAANSSDPLATLVGSFEYNAPYALRGAILALLVVLLMDAHTAQFSKHPRKRRRYAQTSNIRLSLIWGVVAGVIMSAVGFATRLATVYTSINNQGSTRQAIDSIDRGLVAYSTLYSGLIGFLVIFCLSEVFLRPSSRHLLQQDEVEDENLHSGNQ